MIFQFITMIREQQVVENRTRPIKLYEEKFTREITRPRLVPGRKILLEDSPVEHRRHETLLPLSPRNLIGISTFLWYENRRVRITKYGRVAGE